ncbi:MAG: alpha-glucosidase/alpha-galactosidase [Patescibacteria group bacterium]
MRGIKVVFIGAGSASFGPACLRDAVQCPEMRGGTLALVDIDEEALELMASLAERLNKESGAGLKLEAATDRRQVLAGADFVICSIAVRRDELWRLDWEIPRRYGIRQVLGENGGPGGLSHALRNIPIVLGICRDMEELCPGALLINFTNPESRIVMAVDRYTRIRAVGLCHGVQLGLAAVAEMLGLCPEEVDVKAAGLNHLVCFLSLRHRGTGEDLYPRLRALAPRYPDGYPSPTWCGRLDLTFAMLRHFGYYLAPSDDHIGEYLAFGWEKAGLEGYDFEKAARHREETLAAIGAAARGGPLPEGWLSRPSGEAEFEIISAVAGGRNEYILAANIRNGGCITNLPPAAVVEVPAVAGPGGLHGLAMGELPRGIAALCQNQVAVQELAVEAAVHGDREAALQALLLDPVVDGVDTARAVLDELLRVHAPYLPQFEK